ncbi:hypothetical protein RhiJN_23779 [Ceratobasidium sp. AG-Ba]|nr:hypothetical protein RhiJN_23779 [Ceratobasidium sp. AG-Ba]
MSTRLKNAVIPLGLTCLPYPGYVAPKATAPFRHSRWTNTDQDWSVREHRRPSLLAIVVCQGKACLNDTPHAIGFQDPRTLPYHYFLSRRLLDF